MNNYLLRFRDEAQRDTFMATLQGHEDLRKLRFKNGEFIPDLIIFDVEPSTLVKLKGLADSSVRFIEDFNHEPA